jgi:hypothetical protein
VHLKEDDDIVMATIAKKYAVTIMHALTGTWLSRHVDVAIKAVTVCYHNNLHVLEPAISDELWRSSRDLQMAWIRRGGCVLEQFETTVQTDREMVLAVAEFLLRRDWGFMNQAVALSGKVLCCAQPDIRDNVIMAISAVACNAHALAPPICISRGALQQRVEHHLDLRHIFVGDFLRGIAVGVPGSALPTLDRSIETGTAFKQLIAIHLGVPVRALLTVHRQCLDRLNTPPRARMRGRDMRNGGRPIAVRRHAAVEQPAAWDPAVVAIQLAVATEGVHQPPDDEQRAGLLRRDRAMFQLPLPMNDCGRDEDHWAMHARHGTLFPFALSSPR